MEQVFGNYTILEQIGKGDMSTVYRAVETSISRPVAIKILLSSLVEQDKHFAQSFNREVQVAANLQHTHILPVYDFGIHQDKPFIVMAYLQGGTLDNRIQQGAMSLSEVLSITAQLAGALDFAHNQGVIHYDIKPSNVMLDKQGNGYLADFGLAKIVGEHGNSNLTSSKIIGTPDYMAPDFSEAGGITPSVDIYALGVTIYKMFTGRLPFQAGTPMDTIMAHRSQPIPDVISSRPDLPETIQQVISTAMAKKAADRYKTAGRLYEALQTASREAQHAPHGLLFANFQRNVIFVNSQLLQLLKRPESDARALIGRPLEQVLGMELETVKQLIQDVAKVGRIYSRPLIIRNANDEPIKVHATIEATYNEKGVCIGADFSLRKSVQVQREAPIAPIGEATSDTKQNNFLPIYVSSQLEALRALLNRIGGPKLGKTLERIINETTERNEWSLQFKNGGLEGISNVTEPTVYHALLVKAIHYAVSVIGTKIVEKQMKAGEDQMGPAAAKIANQIGLHEIIHQ